MDSPRHIVTVAALVTNQNDEILLIKSPLRGWEFPGGQVEESETLTQALEREIREETGIVSSVGSLVGVYSNTKSPAKVHFGFLAEWTSGSLQTSPESTQVEWVPRDQVLQRITSPWIHDRIKDMLDYTGKVIYRVYTTNPYQIYEQRSL